MDRACLRIVRKAPTWQLYHRQTNLLEAQRRSLRSISLTRQSRNVFKFHNSKPQTLCVSWSVSSLRNVSDIPTPRKPTVTGSPIGWKSVLFLVSCGSIMVLAMKFYKNKREKEVDNEMIKSYGRPELGGDFELIDHTGMLRTNKDFLGQWILIYFGFTHCPDICPEELEKMGNVVDTVNRNQHVPDILPVFISIDPERDTTEAVKAYIADFHPLMVGLTGTREQVDKASHAFRVYYSAGPKDDDSDYLVDHTIIMYLIDPDGDFCEYFGQNKSAGEIASTITATMFKSKRNS
uniref:Protein SCO1 homolog, mitochondrial-like n=1 Tax=Ciona intestinalis TaxID=7719 RepID=F6QE62_CIOIN|nr:protein SCO1 homolog, mitochondrial-like [Ciona intestinalis]|eukprot:XP_002129256.1 protein SCO1 homolog, mitochondrial-like [Ciona intestinalis]